MQESRFHYLNAMYKICELQQTKISAEMKLYVSSDPYEKKKSLRSVVCPWIISCVYLFSCFNKNITSLFMLLWQFEWYTFVV